MRVEWHVRVSKLLRLLLINISIKKIDSIITVKHHYVERLLFAFFHFLQEASLVSTRRLEKTLRSQDLSCYLSVTSFDIVPVSSVADRCLIPKGFYLTLSWIPRLISYSLLGRQVIFDLDEFR